MASDLFSITANAAYTQNDIYTAINSAFEWLDKNASPLNTPDSASSDYYIMALSRMGKKYDYASYVSITETRNPSTKQDGQRLVMSNAACGERLSDSFVGIYTYNSELKAPGDIAGAVITLKSSGYEIEKDGCDFNHLIASLLQMQQANGSFNNDIITTAKSLIALSYFPGLKYEIRGTREDEVYNYSTDDAILNAVTYLESNLSHNNVTALAYVIMALDAIGIDADNDIAFTSDGNSVFGILKAMQNDDGSFNGSAEDTALAVCALTSHLLSMQGKTSFFSFTDSIKADTPLEGENFSGSGIVSDINNTDNSTTTVNPDNTVSITPLPTHAPEHSAFEAEDYGPYPFVGPMNQEGNKKAINATHTEAPVEESNDFVTVVVILIMILCATAIILIHVSKKAPSKLEKLKTIAKKITDSIYEENKLSTGHDLLDELDKTEDVVSKEELYDPNFIKKLIPVDNIDSSIDSILNSSDNTSE